MELLSPPGITNESHNSRSSFVLTSFISKSYTAYSSGFDSMRCLKYAICSRNAPCKAKTPIVTDLSMVIKVVIMMVCVLKGKKKKSFGRGRRI